MYYVGKDGQQSGPFSFEQLQGMAASGELRRRDLVWTEGMPEWRPALELPGLFSAAATPSEVPPPIEQPLFTPPPQESGGYYQPPLAAPPVAPPPNYLVFAIITTLCCCPPGGIPAIVFAAQVNSKFAAGDFTGARKSSDLAKMWCWISFGVGLLFSALWVLGQFAAVSTSK